MRRRLKRVLLGVLLLAGLYLLAVNLLLNTLAPRAFSRRPERFRIEWTAAWSLVPGRVAVRGLQIFGHTRNVSWSVRADRADGWIDLPALMSRTLRVSRLHADGVRSQVRRGPDAGIPIRWSRRRRKPWTLRFEQITLDHIREIRFNDLRLSGDGRGEGSIRTVLGGEFQLDHSTLRMPAGQLAVGAEPIARDIDLQAEARMGPYVVRRHPGLKSFDFLTASLRARGAVAWLPFRVRAGTPEGRPGRLAADLRLEQGRLARGSRFEVTAPSAGPGSAFAMTAAVAPGPGRPALRLAIEARGFSTGRRGGAPPAFRARTLSAASRTLETRLSRIFATARDLRTGDASAAVSLLGQVRAEGVQIAARGSRASLRATLDRAACRLDLAGLLARRLTVDGLQADGVSARLDLARTPPPSTRSRRPWSSRVTGARISGSREIGIGEALLSGRGRAEASFTYGRDGTLAVERAAISLPAGQFRIHGEPAAQDLSLDLEARTEPEVLGRSRGASFLRLVSGNGRLRGRISSLGFLAPYLGKLPWLALEGQGWLSADARLDRGRLVPGSRLTVTASPVNAKIFDSLATGRGTVSIGVEPGKTGPRTSLRVRFDRFSLADLRRRGRPAYLRGRGLRIAGVAPGGLDLTAPVPDFDATLDLPEAEVPDLAAYNALIPEESGLSFISGRGRARVHLETSTATRKARGTATLTSDQAKVQFQNLEVEGAMKLQAPLVSPDLAGRRFDLKGTRLELDGVSYHDIAAESPAEPSPWWMRAALDSGTVVWGAPLSLRGAGRIEMKNSGPLLTLFVERNRFLRWFDDALKVENVTARGILRLGDGAVEIESLQATGGPLELRSRMIFAKNRGTGDLYIRYGRLAAGIELRDGRRSLKLRRPLEWFESRGGTRTSP